MTATDEIEVKKKINSMDALYKNNLAFFKEHVGLIYDHVMMSKDQPELSLEKGSNKALRKVDGQQVYKKNGIDHAIEEVALFKKSMASRFYAPHPNHINVKYLIKKNPFRRTTEKYINVINSEDRTNMMCANTDLVIFGIGLGYHIEMLCNQKKYNNITIIEKNVANLKASMYYVDWRKILVGLKKHSSVTLHVRSTDADDEFFKSTVKQHCHRLFPSIGISTIIYNHYPDANDYNDVKAIIEEYASHIKVSSEIIGPEAQRLFNATQNVKNEYPCINFEKSKIEDGKLLAIIGAGPSLDTYAHLIKDNRDSFYIISAGSGLSSLVKMDITPDLHFELEFQNLAHSLLSHVNESFSLQKLDLIGTYEVNPKFPSLFKNAYMFIPESSELQPVFGEKHTLRRGGITCTNGATALAARLTNQDIYLFGLDFAYTGGEHHCKTNISREENLPTDLQKIKIASETRRAFLPVPSTDGGSTMTSPGLNSARLTMEGLVSSISNCVHNCSLGADIQGTQYLSLTDLELKLSEVENISSPPPLNLTLEKINFNDVQKRTKDVLNNSLSVAKKITKKVKEFPTSPEVINREIRQIFNTIHQYADNDIGKLRNINSVNKFPLLQLFIISGFSPLKYQREILDTWLEDFVSYTSFLKKLFKEAHKESNYLVEKDWME